MSGWGFQRVTKKTQITNDDEDEYYDKKLSRTNVAGRSQMDGNASQKINAVMDELSHDIHKFGRRVHKIQQFTRDLGTARDTEKLRSKLKAERTHAAKINDVIQKNVSKLSRTLLDGGESSNQLSKNGNGLSSDILDPSSLSHRRQQLKKLKMQAQDMERQYTEVLKESLAKEKKFSRKTTLEDEEDYTNDIHEEDFADDLEPTDTKPNTNSTRSIIREASAHVKQQNEEKEKKTTQQMQQQQQLDKQIKLVLSSSDKSTLDVEHMIAAETLKELQELELNYAELHECFTDLNTLIKEQDGSFDVILSNLQETNKNIEMGVEDIKIANGYTSLGGIQKLTKKLGTLGKLL